jgi:hypothetical protein
MSKMDVMAILKVEGGSCVAGVVPFGDSEGSPTVQKICMQERPVSGLTPRQGTHEQKKRGGSSTPVQKTLSTNTGSLPQKIPAVSSARD